MKADGNKDMEAALVKVSAAGAPALDALARRIAKEAPNPLHSLARGPRKIRTLRFLTAPSGDLN